MTVVGVGEAHRLYGVERTRHAIRSGRMQRPVRGVVVTHNGPLSVEERDMVALCSGSPGAALAGATALQYNAHGGIQSLPELDFSGLCRRAGFPVPSRQSVRRRKDGKLYLDVEWEEYALAVEIHGLPHMRVAKWDADLIRNNEVVIDGHRLLIYTSYAIRRDKELVTDQLRRALVSAGWTGAKSMHFGAPGPTNA